MVLAASETTTTTTIRNGGGGQKVQLAASKGGGGGLAEQVESGGSDMDEIKSEKSNGGGSERSGSLKSVKNKTGEYEAEKIRVGRDYQAVCPELLPEKDRHPDQLAEKALLVWSPTKDIPDSKLEDYIRVAKEKYGYNGEQALGMLFWHKHDLERAVMDLANFTPFPDEWTVEDKVLFEQAFQFHGKSFNRIRQMLPDKSIASLVKYYYSWKKSRARPNIASSASSDRAKSKAEGVSENGSEPCSNDVSDEEEKILIDDDTAPRTAPIVPDLPEKAKTPPTPAAPNLDEITIIPITSRSNSKDSDSTTTTTEAPPSATVAKVPKLDTAAVSIIKRPSPVVTANSVTATAAANP